MLHAKNPTRQNNFSEDVSPRHDTVAWEIQKSTRERFDNDEICLLWNFLSRDTAKTQMISMTDCYGSQVPLVRYGTWGDTILDIVMRKKIKNCEMYLP